MTFNFWEFWVLFAGASSLGFGFKFQFESVAVVVGGVIWVLNNGGLACWFGCGLAKCCCVVWFVSKEEIKTEWKREKELERMREK